MPSKTNNLNISKGTKKDQEVVAKKLDTIITKLAQSNKKHELIALNYVIKHRGKVIAGIYGIIYYWGAVYLKQLWVDEKFCGLGLGSKLLNKLELIAKKKKCYLVHLDTFFSKSKNFYLHKGYKVYATINHSPPGYKNYCLLKQL